MFYKDKLVLGLHSKLFLKMMMNFVLMSQSSCQHFSWACMRSSLWAPSPQVQYQNVLVFFVFFLNLEWCKGSFYSFWHKLIELCYMTKKSIAKWLSDCHSHFYGLLSLLLKGYLKAYFIQRRGFGINLICFGTEGFKTAVQAPHTFPKQYCLGIWNPERNLV